MVLVLVCGKVGEGLRVEVWPAARFYVCRLGFFEFWSYCRFSKISAIDLFIFLDIAISIPEVRLVKLPGHVAAWEMLF